MVGNIIHKGNNEKEYPLVLTEAEFLEILNKGIYTRNLIGHQVTLTNSAATSGTNPNYMIVDVNHDSNQLNTYDLMAIDCVSANNYGHDQYYRTSNIRTWLNGTYFNGFSANMQSHIVNIRYNSQGTIYTDDKIIIPSMTEICGDKYNSNYYTKNEGTAYPVISDACKKYNGTNATIWYTRSRSLQNGSYVWIVRENTMMDDQCHYNSNFPFSPLFRVQ